MMSPFSGLINQWILSCVFHMEKLVGEVGIRCNGKTVFFVDADIHTMRKLRLWLHRLALAFTCLALSGDTPLTACIKEGHLDTAKFLISVKADIEARNNAGKTALQYSVLFPEMRITKYLVSMKANIEAVLVSMEANLGRRKDKEGRVRYSSGGVLGGFEDPQFESRLEIYDFLEKKSEIQKLRKERLLEMNRCTFREGKHCRRILGSLFTALKGSHPQGIQVIEDIFEPIIEALFPDLGVTKVFFNASRNDKDENEILQFDEFQSFLWTYMPEEHKLTETGFEEIAHDWLKKKKSLAKKAGHVFSSMSVSTLTSQDFGDAKHSSEGLLSLFERGGYVPIKANEAKTNRTVPVDTKDGSWFEESSLGKGSYGAVYAVEKRVVNQRCAAKVFDLSGKTKKEKDRILRECRLMASLETHPNIIQYVDTIQNGDILCIVMEICPEELSRKINGPKMEARKVKDLILGIGRGLAHLHGQTPTPILHRDLKADNVLISQAGVCKIADIGLATEGGRAADLNTEQLKTIANTKGRTEYQAPERVSDGGSGDMWAAGLILVELATNKLIKDNREMKKASKSTAAWEKKDMIKDLIKETQDKTGDKQLSVAVEKLLECDPKKRMTASQLVELLDPTIGLQNLMDAIKDLKEGLSSITKKLDGLFQTVLNFNLDEDSKNIPNHFLLVPGAEEFGDETAGRWFGELFSRSKEKLGIQRTLWLYISDEAHLLDPKLTNGQTIPATTKLIHKPMQIIVPGETMIKLAPLLRVLSVALLAAKVAGTVTTGVGVVIPNGIPGLDKLQDNRKALASIYKTIEGLSENDHCAEVIENEESNIDKKANTDVLSSQNPQKAVGEAYSVLKSLLKKDDEGKAPTTKDGDSLDDLLRNELVRMVHPEEGKVRWFARHDDKDIKDDKRFKLLESCGWKADQRDDSSLFATQQNQVVSSCCVVG